MEIERSQIEAERQRAEEALRAELRRQAGERALDQFRLIASWLWCSVSAARCVAARERAGVPRGLLGVGWVLTLGARDVLAAWQRASAWTAETRQTTSGAAVSVQDSAVAAAPWLLIGALALTAARLIMRCRG